MPLATRSDRVRRVAFAAVVAGAWVLLFREALSPGFAVLRSDLGLVMWPARRLFVFLAAASEGLPSWNPFVSAGQPFAANPQYAVFHPLTSLFLLLPFDWAFRLQVLAPPLAAAAAMGFLLRVLRLSPVASLFGAIGWAFGGYVLSAGVYLPILLPVCLLPATLAYAVRLGRAGRSSDVAGLAVFFGLEALAGEPTSLLATLLLSAAAFALGCRASGGATPASGPLLRRAARLAAGFCLGAVVGAATLLPGLRLLAHTSRAAGLPAEQALAWSLPPVRLAELIVPDLTDGARAPAGMAALRARLYPSRPAPFFASLYPGLIVTALAAYAFARGAAGVRAFLPLVALGALLAVGPETPVFDLARRWVPALSQNRFPEKFVLLVALPLAVAGAAGLDALLAAPRRDRRVLASVLALLGACLGAAALVVSARGAVGTASPWISGRLLHAAAAALLGALLVALTGAAPRAAGAALVLLLAGDLVSEGRRLLPASPIATVTAPPSVLRPLVSSRPSGYLFHLAWFHPTLGLLGDVGAPPRTAQFGIATALDRDWGATQLAWSARAVHAVSRAVEEDRALAGPLLARRGISTVLRFRPGAPLPSSLGSRPLSDFVEIWSVADPQPLVFPARSVRLFGSEDEWVDAVRRLGAEARSTVFLEGSRGEDRPPVVSAARLEIAARRPDALTVLADVSAPGPALVSINQTWDPFWRASVDGVDAPLLRADFDLTALFVPAGRHRIELRYRDPLLAAGVALTLLALGFSIVLALRS